MLIDFVQTISERGRVAATSGPVLVYQYDGREDGVGGVLPQQDLDGSGKGANVCSYQ